MARLSQHDVTTSCRYLTATDFSECHDRQATLKRIQLLEASVAASLGISMVYSSPALRAKPEYYRYCILPCDRRNPCLVYLSQLMAHGATTGEPVERQLGIREGFLHSSS